MASKFGRRLIYFLSTPCMAYMHQGGFRYMECLRIRRCLRLLKFPFGQSPMLFSGFETVEEVTDM